MATDFKGILVLILAIFELGVIAVFFLFFFLGGGGGGGSYEVASTFKNGIKNTRHYCISSCTMTV